MRYLKMLMLAVLLPLATMADNHEGVEAEIREAEKTFNGAYASNDVDTYFSFYTEDATLYFFGARQRVTDYNEEWHAMIAAGGGVVRNDLSDMQVQVLPGSEAAVATYFVDNESKSPEGETSTAKAFETDVWQKIDGEWKIISMHYTEL